MAMSHPGSAGMSDFLLEVSEIVPQKIIHNHVYVIDFFHETNHPNIQLYHGKSWTSPWKIARLLVAGQDPSFACGWRVETRRAWGTGAWMGVGGFNMFNLWRIRSARFNDIILGL